MLSFTGCLAKTQESGEWRLQSARIPYSCSLLMPVTVGAVREVDADKYIVLGDIIPLHVSEHDTTDWSRILWTAKTPEAYSAELADRSAKRICEVLGLSHESAASLGVSRVEIHADGRSIQLLQDRLLFEDVINDLQYPVSEIEAIHTHVKADAPGRLKMCVFEETAESVTIAFHCASGSENNLEDALNRLVNIKRKGKEWTVQKSEISGGGRVVRMTLIGKFVLRRSWASLLCDKYDRLTIEWSVDSE